MTHLLQVTQYQRSSPSKLKGIDPRKQLKPHSVSFHLIAPFCDDGPFKPVSFPGDFLDSKAGEQFWETFRRLIEGIYQGLFFILPQEGGYCQYCDYATICRKNHPPSRFRAENDPRALKHLEIRKLKIEKE